MHMVRVLIFTLCLLTQIDAYQSKLANYILSDIDTNVSLITRIEYDQLESNEWQFHSMLGSQVHFPKMKSYLDVYPFFEFNHVSDHNDNSASITRLTQAYLTIDSNRGRFTIGKKGLNFLEGQFISQSRFNLIPRVFNQISYQTPLKNHELIYLIAVQGISNEIPQTFKKGGVIFNGRTPLLLSIPSAHFSAFIIEDIPDTFMIANQRKSPLTFTVAYQKDPSLKQASTAIERQAYYYDIGYTISDKQTSVLFKSRYFSGGETSKQYVAPFSSGHSLDGYSNVHQPSVINGFDHNFRSFQLGFTTQLKTKQSLALNGYLFRNSSLTKNLGAELNLAVSKHILFDSIIWTYKLSHFFTGDHTTHQNQLNMWLDFQLTLNKD